MKQSTQCITRSHLLIGAAMTTCLCSSAVASVITAAPSPRATDAMLHWPHTTCYSTASGEWGGIPTYSQCGGKNYRGPKMCSGGSICMEVNEHYSVCLPYKGDPCIG